MNNTVDQIHQVREWLSVAGNIIIGSVFIGGLMALVVFLDSLMGPLK